MSNSAWINGRYDLAVTNPTAATTDGPAPKDHWCDLTVPMSVRGAPVCAERHHACRHGIRVVDGRTEIAITDSGWILWVPA